MEPKSALAAVVAHRERVPVVGTRVDIQQAHGLCSFARRLENVRLLRCRCARRHRAEHKEKQEAKHLLCRNLELAQRGFIVPIGAASIKNALGCFPDNAPRMPRNATRDGGRDGLPSSIVSFQRFVGRVMHRNTGFCLMICAVALARGTCQVRRVSYFSSMYP